MRTFPPSPHRQNHTAKLAATVVLALVLAGGAFVGAPTPVAAQCAPTQQCPSTGVSHSTLEVDHVFTSGGIDYPVEPDDSDVWDIDASWLGQYVPLNPTCSCLRDYASAAATVTWNGSGWSASCFGCDAVNGPIYSVTVCDVESCDSLTHGWSYRLIVAIDDAILVCGGTLSNFGFLDRVTYTAVSADDGHVIDDDECEEGASVTWVSPVAVTGTDFGAFECAQSCNSVGINLTLHYQ